MDITQLVFSVERCYLMKAQDKYILIDTGYAFEWEDFRTKLKDAGIGFQDISHIILTHHHDDHCGMLNDIIRENTDIRVVMSNLAPTLLQKGGKRPQPRRRAGEQTHPLPFYARRTAEQNGHTEKEEDAVLSALHCTSQRHPRCKGYKVGGYRDRTERGDHRNPWAQHRFDLCDLRRRGLHGGGRGSQHAQAVWHEKLRHLHTGHGFIL